MADTDTLPDESVLVREGCNASDLHLTCSYPTCTCKQIPAAVKAALSVLPSYMRGWKDISLAPKDGHRYLIAGEQQNVQWVAIGHYAPYDGCRWLSDDEKQLRFPTHFMELPPPPSQIGEE